MTGHPSDLKTGTVIDGRYRINLQLGVGGFGVVYQAKQLSTGQTVALKVLLSERVAKSRHPEIEIARFEREMLLIAKLEHTNIVRLIDSGRLPDGRLYTTLEFVPGSDLATVLEREGRLEPSEAKRIMLQVLDALSCAHSRGIVHRDLKPANIMLAHTGARRNAMVLDFGIAGLLSPVSADDVCKLTEAGQFPGTPSYMAPEQLEEKPLSPQSDLYSWGLTFLECLTGKPAVDAPSLAAIVFKQLSPQPIVLPRELMDHPLGMVIAKALVKDLGGRYSSASEIYSRLEGCDVSSLRIYSDIEPRSSDIGIGHRLTKNDDTLATTGPSFIPRDMDSKATDVTATPRFEDDLGRLSTENPLDDDETEKLKFIKNEPTKKRPKTRWWLALGLGVLTSLAVVTLLLTLQGSQPSSDGATASNVPAKRPPKAKLPTAAADLSRAFAAGSVAAANGPPPSSDVVEVPAREVSVGLTTLELQRYQNAFPDHSFDLTTKTGVLAAERFTAPVLRVHRTEVTDELWTRAGGLSQQVCAEGTAPRLFVHQAVTNVSPLEAEGFCAQLGMRLPTSMEWESLARGPSSRQYPFDGDLTEIRRAELRTKSAPTSLPWNQTSEGLYDMAGGVWEWVTCGEELGYCTDGYALRGGAWDEPDAFWFLGIVSAPGLTKGARPDCFRRENIGFRCISAP